MIRAYFRAFVNYKQSDWARLLSIVKFAYNNAKNLNTGHKPFELNYNNYSYVFYKKDIHPCSKLKLADKLSIELRKLMTIYKKNIYHTQRFQKRVYDKVVKPKALFLATKFS